MVAGQQIFNGCRVEPTGTELLHEERRYKMRMDKASKESIGGLFFALHEISIIKEKSGNGFVLPISEVGKMCKAYQVNFDDVCSLAVAIAVGVNRATDEEMDKARRGGIR